MPKRARAVLAASWAAGLLAGAVLLQRPSPLFVNLGAGDEPFAHGFRTRWEREGRRGNPDTMFRWTEDGARLRLPVAVAGDDVKARIRLARFAPAPADVRLLSAGREVERWTQESRGFHVREFALGAPGTIDLQFRSDAADGGPLGVALDWVEITGAGGIRAPAGTTLRAIGLLLALPALAAALAGVDAALALGAVLAWCAAGALALDRMGALLALASACAPALLAAAAITLAVLVLRRAWPDGIDRRAAVVPLGAAALLLALVVHPFYYYPDVDRHRVLLHALQGNPTLLVDPTQPWPRQVTREIGGREVALPYAFVFHAVAWPLAGPLGEVEAMKTAGVAALGLTLVLVFPLARAAGLGAAAAVLAQVLAAAIPVSTSRAVLALYPTLLGQAAVVLLLAHLARRLARLDGARDAAAACAFLLLAQAVYTGSLITVGALVAALALAELAAGERRRAWRLLGAWGVAAALALAQYAGFFPVVWRDVLPYVGESPPATHDAAGPALLRAAVRLGVFFDAIYPALALAGLLALRAVPHPRRVLASALAAGSALAVLRFVAPTLLADAKEVELMAAPMAVASAAALSAAWARGGAARAASVAAGLTAIGWGGWQSMLHYADRFTAAGR